MRSLSSVKHCKICNCLEFKSGHGSSLERLQRLKCWSNLLMLTLALEKTKPHKSSNFKRLVTICTLLNMGAHVLSAHNIG